MRHYQDHDREPPAGLERRVTVGADKAYDTAGFVPDLRQMRIDAARHSSNKGRCSPSMRARPVTRVMR